MSFTQHRLENIDSLADVAGLILNENIDIYELVTTLTPEGVADFIGAASKAAEAGKKEFEFGGKTYPVKISKDVASKVAKKMNDSKSLEEYSEGGYPAQEISYLPKDKKTGEVLEVDPKTEDPVHGDNVETKDGEKEEEENDPTKEMKGGKAKNEGFTDEEVRALCHSKDHDCATIIEHPEFGLGKPVHGSHAIPNDEGFVEWYDVEFKHGIEEKVYTKDVKVLASEGHHKSEDDEDPNDEDSKDEGIGDAIRKLDPRRKKAAQELKKIQDMESKIDPAMEKLKQSIANDKEEIEMIQNSIEDEDYSKEEVEKLRQKIKTQKLGIENTQAKIFQLKKSKEKLADKSAAIRKKFKGIRVAENITMVDDFPITEGKMKELHMDIKAGKSADEIIKSNKLPNTPALKKYINSLIKDTK